MTLTTLSEGREFPFFNFSDVLGTLNEYEKKHAPDRAFYAGNLDLLKSGGRVSVVGTRKPTFFGAKRAKELTKMLIENGITEGLPILGQLKLENRVGIFLFFHPHHDLIRS